MTDRWKRIVPPLAGLGLVACVVVAMVLTGNGPSAGASGAKVSAYFTSHHGRANASAFLFAYAAAMSVVFFAGMAVYLRRRGSHVLSAVTAAGGILMAGGLLAGAGLLSAIADSTGKLSDSSLQAVNQIGSDAPWIALLVGSAIATLSIGIAALRTQALPKALGIITVVVGVVQVSGIGSWFGFLATGPLTLALAYYLYERTGQPDTITMPDVPTQRDAVAETQARSHSTKA